MFARVCVCVFVSVFDIFYGCTRPAFVYNFIAASSFGAASAFFAIYPHKRSAHRQPRSRAFSYFALFLV